MSDTPDSETTQAQRQFLTFRIGEDVYALPVGYVNEVIEFGYVTDVPMMPDFLRGVINLRGMVMPVIDLSVRLGKERLIETKRTCIIIVNVPDGKDVFQIGLMVDAVNVVVEAMPEEYEGKPRFGAGIRMDFVSGVIAPGGKLIIVLDIMQVLSGDELSRLIVQSARDAVGRMKGGAST